MTINEIQNEIIENFSDAGDWLDKYELLIEMGKSLKTNDKELQKEENLIRGCQSNTWIKATIKNNDIYFSADSETLLTKGIIFLLLKVVNNKPADEIVSTDFYFIDKIGLSTNLSPSRSNGLVSIIKEIKKLAAGHLK